MAQNIDVLKRDRSVQPRRFQELILSRAQYGPPLIIIGWLLLLLYMLVDVLSGAPASGNFIGFAISLIVTGFAIATLATLEKIQTTLGRILMYQAAAATPRPAESKPPKKQPSANKKVTIVKRGEIEGRRYVVFTDGTVIVETKFGRRRFSSIKDAHEFVGA